MSGLIAASLALLFAACVTLGFGWLGADSALITVSIACSTGTAVTLAAAYSRSKRMADTAQRQARPTRTRRPPGSGGFATQAMGRPDTRTRDRTSPNDGEVIAVPVRRKFHRPECRYAGVKGATKMTRSAARRHNFDACGICKP